MRKYDGTYIFVGLAKDDNVDALLDKAQSEITRLNGVVVNTEVLGKRTFARPMNKKESGVYARIRFEMDPAKVNALRDRYLIMEDMFRVQLQVVDERREATLAEQAVKFKAREEARQAAAEAAAEAAEENDYDDAVESDSDDYAADEV
ncbi:MAG: 30S ribosomal protein S6 [Lentisphaerae bacterium]|jgi:small subunit ribosomal protein S6|nr:30S ribosomal protein S6 [Lentisphaerota bacterium]